MSTTVLAYEARRGGLLQRLADYVELTKPRISLLVLVTVAGSAFIARFGVIDLWLIAHAVIGTTLVAASASALNQWLECDRDKLMPRTANRPLPAGRLGEFEVLAFGAFSVFAGLAYLAWMVNLLTAVLGLCTWVCYVCLYTPLKSRTPANTAIGAIGGAMPVLMGWTASGAPLNLGAATLFLIVYLWQFPHFMAIAWLYREQYAAAGMKMLPVVDPSGRRASLQAVVAALALLPVSLLPVAWQWGGSIYLSGALVLGLGQLMAVFLFVRRLDESSARLLLRASLVYLPSLWSLLMLLPLV